MATKALYKVPSSLDRSYLDQELVISGGGLNAPPTSMRSILFYICCAMVGMWMVVNTFVKDAPIWLRAVFLIWVLCFAVFFGRTTRTKELKIGQVRALLEYLPAGSRRVMTRSNSAAGPFSSIVGIDEIEEKTGVIRFLDGRYGKAYLVVGSASALLFDEDRLAILDRVDAYWRKVPMNVDYAFITNKEPQRIYKQVAHLERVNRALEVRDPELLDLMDERYDILVDYVGGQFKSIHQYLVIMADNLDALRQAHNVVSAEVEGSSLMIKSCTQLDRKDALEMFSVLYQGNR